MLIIVYACENVEILVYARENVEIIVYACENVTATKRLHSTIDDHHLDTLSEMKSLVPEVKKKKKEN